jgi:hypothetical protein
MSANVLQMFIVLLVSFLIAFGVGLNNNERTMIISFIKNKLK